MRAGNEPEVNPFLITSELKGVPPKHVRIKEREDQRKKARQDYLRQKRDENVIPLVIKNCSDTLIAKHFFINLTSS